MADWDLTLHDSQGQNTTDHTPYGAQSVNEIEPQSQIHEPDQ